MLVKSRPPEKVDVIICLYTRVEKIPKSLRDLVGLLVVDEIHKFCNETGVKSMLAFQPRYLLSATATFEKENEMHLAMEAFVGNEKVDTTELLPFRVTKYNTGITGKRVMGPGGIMPDWHKLNESLLYNPERNAIVIYLVLSLLQLNRKILVFTTEVEHVSVLHGAAKAIGVESCDYLTGSKKQYNDSTVLFGTKQYCGTGFDEEMHCNDFGGKKIDTVVLTGPVKDRPLLYQMCGRSFRSDDPWIIHLVDDDETTIKQWNQCAKWYRSVNATMDELTFDNEARDKMAAMMADRIIVL